MFQESRIATESEFSFVGFTGSAFGGDDAGKFKIGTQVKVGNYCFVRKREFVDNFLLGISLVLIFFGDDDGGKLVLVISDRLDIARHEVNIGFGNGGFSLIGLSK